MPDVRGYARVSASDLNFEVQPANLARKRRDRGVRGPGKAENVGQTNSRQRKAGARPARASKQQA